jgi:hypothetical protein
LGLLILSLVFTPSQKAEQDPTTLSKSSFEKYTGDMFLKQLRIHKENLSEFETEQDDRYLSGKEIH